MSNNETNTENSIQPEMPTKPSAWQTPELLTLKINVDTEVGLCGSHPCDA